MLPAFDSHKFVKKFTASGFNEVQSEVLVELALESQNYQLKNLATKEDVRLLRKDMQSMESGLRKDMQSMIAETKNSILRWVFPLLLTNTMGLLAICARIFFK